MKRKVFSLLLILCMAVSLLPAVAAAAEGFSFSVNNGEATLIGCAETVTGDVRIPESYLGNPVTAIGERAFLNADRAGITSLTIPEGVKRIGRFGCADLTNLTAVTLPSSLEILGEGAFNGCASLKEITLPDRVTEIGPGAFQNCSELTSLKLPSRLKTMGESAFSGCYDLQSVAIPEGVKEIPDRCFYGCGRLTEVQLPAGLQTIGKDAFSLCGLTSVTLPNGLEMVGDRAFFECRTLRNVTLPDTLKTVGAAAFGCTNSCKRFIHFAGAAPALSENTFSGSVMIGFYPDDQAKSWFDAMDQSFGAEICYWRPDSALLPVSDSAREKSEALTPTESDNRADQNYARNWAAPVYSNLYANEDGTLMRVEGLSAADGCTVVVEQYTEDGKLLWKKTIEGELPIFGGFYRGTDYNFLVFGQRNDAEDNEAEVIRVVRYTKNWHRIDGAGIYGSGTVSPFEAGSCRMVQSGDFLYLHTSHLMYRHTDGNRHQSNLSFDIHIPTMTAFRSLSGYVSHSFNQFILADGADVLRLDHGDAYPRAVQISRFDGAAGWFSEESEQIEALPIYGKLGANDTGVELGGFEASDSSWLTVGVSRAQAEAADSMKNVFVAATNKETLKTTVHWLTDHESADGVKVSNPQIVKISDERFLLLWTENNQLRYVFLNGAGKAQGTIYSVSGIPLSDCKPVFTDNSVIWYVTDKGTPAFCRIQLNKPERIGVAKDGVTVTGGTVTNVGGFQDVLSDQYFADAVEWAVAEGVTTGVSDRFFAPGNTCTRGQMVTFLWRAAGQPEPKSADNPFKDVKASDYYSKAVLWALEQGITTGTSETTFEPDATVTRAQTVTFLWRMAQKPKVEASNPFTDVSEGQYYTDAVLWAVQKKITNGVDATHFAPDARCTRGQIVTFLYRDFG